MREAMFDVAGQDIMTADKVTLRMNAVVTYRVVDARQAVSAVDDVRQALYREAQLALRAVVGARELDTFLTEKDGVASELADMVRRACQDLGRGADCGRYPRRHPAGRDEGPDEQGHGGQEGRRGQPHRSPRGDGRHAQPGQHRQAAGRQPDPDAPARAGGPGKDRRRLEAQHRVGRKGPDGPGDECVVMTKP